MSSPDPAAALALAATATATATALGAGLSAWWRRAFRRDEEKERTRLRNDVLGPAGRTEPTVINLGTDSTLHINEVITGAVGAKSPDASGSTDTSLDSTEETRVSQADITASAHNARFALLLVDYYAYGLTQARRSFAVSLACSMLGGLVLIAGVALAIFRADTNGEVYAGVVTSVAGVLTTSIGVLFHQQANRALKHMEDQTNKLRQDMKAERDAGTAVELLEKVTDNRLRGRLQAALILRFSGAELPDTDASGNPVFSANGFDGQRPSSEARAKAYADDEER
jgi:membrane protein implicated in regulation of membrane protease activity